MTSPEPASLGSKASFELDVPGGRERIDVFGDGVVRVRISADGSWREARDWDVLEVPGGAPLDAVVDRTGARWRVDAGSIGVEVDPGTGAVAFCTSTGDEFAADDGVDAITIGRDRVTVRKRRHPDERHAGFGERPALDQTAGTKTFWNVNAKLYGPDVDAMYCSVPVFVAVRPGLTYGVYLNALGWSQIRTEPGAGTWGAEVAGGELDYVVAHGADPATVVERLTAVLGRIELPPRWALGYQQSHWGYDSAARVIDVAEQFRRRRIRCDAFHLDIDHMDRHQVFTWDPDRFPDPGRLIGELAERGMRCVTIVDPGVKLDQNTDVFTAGSARDAFVRDGAGDHVTGFVWPGRCVLPDFLRSDVREWWGDLHAVHVDAGVAGIWNDMNEPALYAQPVGTDVNATLVEVPADAGHGPVDDRVAHGEVHNVYGLSMARTARDAMRRLRPGERSFVLTRSGFAGIQRYAAVWTGDNTASWEHLRMSLPMLCNLGLSGVPFAGADIGGFWHDATPELYARWIQVGVLYPMMRGHSHKDAMPNEPWAFGDEVESVARDAIRLRTELRPYLYSLFHEAATTGAPILRPLLWAFPDDERAVVVDDEVLLGDAVLAAPVVHEGERRRRVYLPAGRWYDWWTGEAHDGPVDIEVDAPLDRLPLFGRAGTVVPLASLRDDCRDDESVVMLRVFPGDGSGSLYDDDGETYAYRDGAFAQRRYDVVIDGDSVTVRLAAAGGTWTPPARRLVFTTPRGHATEVADTGAAIEVTLPAG